MELKGKGVPDKQLLRLNDWFSKYQFTVQHVKGKTNIVPDYLSRRQPVQMIKPPKKLIINKSFGEEFNRKEAEIKEFQKEQAKIEHDKRASLFTAPYSYKPPLPTYASVHDDYARMFGTVSEIQKPSRPSKRAETEPERSKAEGPADSMMAETSRRYSTERLLNMEGPMCYQEYISEKLR